MIPRVIMMTLDFTIVVVFIIIIRQVDSFPQFWPLSSPTDAVHDTVQHVKPCFSNTDCLGDRLAYCDITSKICSCPLKSSSDSLLATVVDPVDSTIKCLDGKKLGESCSFHQECRVYESASFCHRNKSICQSCSEFSEQPLSTSGKLDDDHHHVNSNITFNIFPCQANGTKETSPAEDDTNLAILPIMIVMGLMFIGMCAALNMMSRARFRNSRGVFNQPHAARALKDVQVTHEEQKRRKKERRFSQIRGSPRLSLSDGGHPTPDGLMDTLDPRSPHTPRDSDVSAMERPVSTEGRKSPA